MWGIFTMKKEKIKRITGALLSLIIIASLILTACSKTGNGIDMGKAPESDMSKVNESREIPEYDGKEKTCYEVFVYSFSDSDGDGIGDFKGLTDNLSYINDGDPEKGNDLSADMIWLMPICPSPTYHKYDVTDYMDVDPQYGTMEDFEKFIDAAHKNGVSVIIDLVLNHTSIEHPWFKKAVEEEKAGEALKYADYYNFTTEKMAGYEPLDKTDLYYEARFWSGMPDLNLDNEDVRKEIEDIVSFWLDKGVDGFRLDAVTSYYTGDDKKNIEFLTWLNKTVKEKNPDAYIVGECWAGLNTYAKYYESGVDSFFDFQFADSDGAMANVVRGTKKAASYGKAVADAEDMLDEINPDHINAPFIANHDMGRSSGFFANDDGTKTKMAGAVYLLSGGTTYTYYGEEIGMRGSGKDENKRAPMLWDENVKAAANGIKPESNFDPLSVQKDDPKSIYEYYRQAIRIRNNFPVIKCGKTEVLEAMSDDDVLSMKKNDPDGKYESVIVIYNFSDEEKDVKISEEGYNDIVGVLYTGNEEAKITDGTVKVPARGVVILKEKP